MSGRCGSCGAPVETGTPGCAECERRARGDQRTDRGVAWAAPSTGSWAGVIALGLVVVVALAGWAFRDQLGIGRSTAGPSAVAVTGQQNTGTADVGPPGTDSADAGTPDDAAPDGASARLVNLPVLDADADETAPDGVDANKNPVSYHVDNTFDRRRSTAWRAEGDGTGLRLTFSFASPVHILRVGLIPGYDKVDPNDGTDRFTEERRITAVDWDFGDGTHASQDLEDSRALQSLAVDATTSTVTLTIQGTTRPGKRDYTAISEVLFRGTP
jgi:hypothetical protein